MTDPSVGANAGVGGIIEAFDRLKGYFDGYRPDKRSVTYDYRNRTSEMMLKITVPNNLGRRIGKVEIPIADGFRFRDMFSAGDFAPVRAPWTKTEKYWVLDPTDLPAGEDYLVRLDKQDIDDKVFKNIIELTTPPDPMSEGGNDVYYVHSAIKEPKILAEIYEEFRVDNVDLEVKVAVQRCFSTAIPERVIRGFKRTRRLLEASNRDDVRELRQIHRLRKGTRDHMSVSEGEAAGLIRSLASAEHFNDFISVSSPYKREEITQTTYQQNYLPEQVNVDISTNLDLDQKAAKGKLEFFKDEYTEYLEEETEDLL